MRAYQNDNVQVRVLVGAHVFAHQFNLAGPTWFSEPSWKNSGYRSAQAMGLSEHFELLFRVLIVVSAQRRSQVSGWDVDGKLR